MLLATALKGCRPSLHHSLLLDHEPGSSSSCRTGGGNAVLRVDLSETVRMGMMLVLVLHVRHRICRRCSAAERLDASRDLQKQIIYRINIIHTQSCIGCHSYCV